MNINGTKRNQTVDIAKGVAILLVIYGHVIQILYTGTEANFFDDIIEKVICSFHMPLFSLLSGYLFYASYRKYNLKTLFCKRVVGLLQPLLIWGSLYYLLYQFLLKILGGGILVSKNGGIPLQDHFFGFCGVC